MTEWQTAVQKAVTVQNACDGLALAWLEGSKTKCVQACLYFFFNIYSWTQKIKTIFSIYNWTQKSKLTPTVEHKNSKLSSTSTVEHTQI